MQHRIGFALHQAQTGLKPRDSKPMKGFGAGVLEVMSDHRSDTFRAVYVVRLVGTVYVLHAFQRKSRHGIATPNFEIELIKTRLRAAILHHEDWRGSEGR